MNGLATPCQVSATRPRRRRHWRRTSSGSPAFQFRLYAERLRAVLVVTVVKFFLFISKDEQKRRLEARLQDPDKNWKFTPSDLAERKLWSDYMEAFEDALTKCSTPWAPWHVIPANKKWFRNLAVSQILVETLERMDPRFPKPAFDPTKLRVQ